MRYWCRIMFCIGCLAVLSQQVAAQWRSPLITPLGPAEGLPGIVNRIVQDSTGYIYIASNVGLYRYDGHSFTFFGHDPLNPNSIAAGEVLNIIAGRDGLIWLAMRFGGLNSFNPKTGQFKRYPLPPTSFPSESTVNALYEAPDGILWIGATDFRLLAFDRTSESFTSFTPGWIDPASHPGRLSILSITPAPNHPDSLWLCVLDYASAASGKKSFGQVIFNTQSQQFRETPFTGMVRYVDRDGIMWATHWGNYILRLDPDTWQQDSFVHHFVLDGRDLTPLSRDIIRHENQLLVASSYAVMEFKDSVYQTIIKQPTETENYSLFSDRNHNLWIGTSQGVQVINPDNQHIRYYDFDEVGVFKRLWPACLAYDETADAVLLSHTFPNHPSGYYVIPLNESPASIAQFVPTPFVVEAIAVDHQHRLWAAGDGQLFSKHLNDSKTAFRAIPADGNPIPSLMHMSTDAQGRIGMIGSREFIWFHPEAMQLKRIHLDTLRSTNAVKLGSRRFDGFSFAPGNKAYLFSEELYRVDLVTGDVMMLKYDAKVNPNNQYIQFAGEDAEGYVWMSTYVHTGRYRLKGDSLVLIDTYGPLQGMMSPGASQLHIDDQGRVWSFTGNGLQAIDPHTHEVHLYGTKEGLPFPFLDPIQVLSLPGDRIATVCHNGLIVYPAGALWDAGSHQDVPVVLTRLRVNGKVLLTGMEANAARSISMSANNKGIDIEFQALVYPTDYRVVYSYRITGLQDDWISIDKNQLITLPSLPPGEFVFEIKAGQPESEATSKTLHIEVAEPLIQRTWFIALLMLTVIALLYGLMQYRIRTIRHREEMRASINTQMAELELKALRAQMNPHFMFNSLNSIKNYILRAEPKLAAEYLSNFAHLIRMILQNSREKVISLQSEMETLLLYIELEQVRFDNRFSFHCEVDEALPVEQVMIPPMLLQPYVENAIWHGLMHKSDQGHLSLRFALDADKVVCTIEDDGVGRAKAAEMKSRTTHQYKSMGMGITHDRIEIMNKLDALGITAEIIDKTDESGDPSGTRVVIRIPKPADQL